MNAIYRVIDADPVSITTQDAAEIIRIVFNNVHGFTRWIATTIPCRLETNVKFLFVILYRVAGSADTV